MSTPLIDLQQLQTAYEKAQSDLLAQRTATGHWEGQLSSSALSTATAISALALAVRESADPEPKDEMPADDALIRRGIAWLAKQQNQDGGWGDTDKSHSNIATSMLAVAAIHLAPQAAQLVRPLERAASYIEKKGLLVGLRRRYGRDKTFAVPILTNYALAGLVDWEKVPPLPFELSCIPHKFYRLVRMPVVSYAIPALVAMGQARFFHRPPRFPITWLIRRAAIGWSLRVLLRMQPPSGGYLEAVPLTSFVAMSLTSIGRLAHPVTQRGLEFIRDSVRPDGSWPIDTNLATWNTSLALNALADGRQDVASLANLEWFLDCQHAAKHPFTGAAAGGWGWTDLSGAVPDADDTAGALLALWHWHKSPSCPDSDRRRIELAAERGVRWLLGLQNSDGGWPTFCRGWGRFPFDRSGADLTAHAMRALHTWRDVSCRQITDALDRGWSFLGESQCPDGSWVPLWFGHQDHPAEENPVFGTARVLMAYNDLLRTDTQAAKRGYEWLMAVQCADGGWSGGERTGKLAARNSAASVEETALALEALIGAKSGSQLQTSLAKGLQWLVDAVLADRHMENAPIGFYFAKLWYYERLYPLTFTVAALGRAVRRFATQTT